MKSRKHRHLAERAEFAGGRGGLEVGLQFRIGHSGAFRGVNRLIRAEQIILLHRHLLVERGIGGVQLLRGGGFLHVAEERRAENADGQHADAAHRVQRERAAAWALLGGQAENGRPEKRDADAEQRGGGENGAGARVRGLRQREDAQRGQRGTGEQQAEAAKIYG